MRKRVAILVLIVVVVFGGLLAFNLIRSILMKRFFATYQPPAVHISSAVAEAVNWQHNINSVGNFVAINGVDISSEAAGTVTQIQFDSGQFIKKNAPLITIDDSVDQALLKFHQAELTLKELNYKRQTDLYKRGATPSSNVDEAKASLQQAQAQVEQRQAQINHKHILAPFDGRLGIREVNLGQYITPGQTTVVSLQSLDPLYLEFYLPEQLYKHIKIGQKIRFAVEAFPNALFEGNITAINSKVDLTTHNVQIRAQLPNCPSQAIQDPQHSALIKTRRAQGSKLIVTCNTEWNTNNKVSQFVFIPGMFASVAVDQGHQPNTLVVPSTAISYSLYGNAVYLIEKDKEKPDLLTVKRIFVTTGEEEGHYTVIKKGLRPGQLVVSTGDLKLQNGTHVLINNDVLLNKNFKPDALGQ